MTARRKLGRRPPARHRMNGPYKRGARWRVHITTRTDGQPHTSYKFFDSYNDAADFMDVDIGRMTAESDCLLRRVNLVTSSMEGWVYVVALAPEVSRRRLKVGFTKNLALRFRSLRTANPTCLLVAAWEADAAAETAAHRLLRGRIGTSEVFLVPSIHGALDELDKIPGRRLEPLADIGRPKGSRPRVLDRDYATARQRAPRPNGKPAIADLVIRDVRARQDLGRQRYGVDLQANNGRDALVDAYQEAIDLAMYMRQLLEERGRPHAAPDEG